MDLATQLKRDEGEKLVVYLDSKGIRSGGVGHNLEAHGIDWPVGTTITQDQSDQWLDEDTATAHSLLATHIPWSLQLDPIREAVLLNMVFNMGWGDGTHGLSAFHHTLAMIEAGNYAGAAEAMLESAWAREVGPRATRLAQQIETGAWV